MLSCSLSVLFTLPSVFLITLLDVSTANCSNYKRFSLFDSYLSIYLLDTLSALIRSLCSLVYSPLTPYLFFIMSAHQTL